MGEQDNIRTFEDAIKDRLIDKTDVGNHLSHFTLQDWRAAAQHLNQKKAGMQGLFGGIDEMTIKETDTEFVINNDKDALRDQGVVQGAKDLGLWTPTFAAIGASAGWLASRYCSTPYLKLGGAALGIAAGIWKTRSDQAAIDSIATLRVPKSKLIDLEQ